MFSKTWSPLRLYPFEEIGMITSFSKLHQQVQIMLFIFIRGVSILQQIFINFVLHISEPNKDVNLLFGREIFFYFCLCSSEHKRFQNFVQLTDHMNIPFLNFLLSLLIFFACAVKPHIKHF
jgi:hypothetical protein